MKSGQVEVQGLQVNYKRIKDEDYISLTDIAKVVNAADPSGVIRNWMSNKDSFAFYSLWEEINNPNFNSVEMRRIKTEEVGYNRFTMTPKRWKTEFNAIGIIPSAGKYSAGTFAHRDIAFEFASWLSPEFKLYLITEFQRLKFQEQKELEWTAKRELAKVALLLPSEDDLFMFDYAVTEVVSSRCMSSPPLFLEVWVIVGIIEFAETQVLK